MRLAAAVTLLVCFTGVGVARAQTDKAPLPDAAGATAAPSVAVTPDGGAPAPAPDQPPLEAAPAESGPGLFEQSTAAAASAPAGGVAAEPAAPPVGPFTLSGYVRGDMFAGKVNGENAGELKSGYGELDLTLRTKKETYGDGFAEARLRYGLQGDGTQGTVVEVREAYVNAYLGPLDLRLGQQIVVWGRADALNPTNNLTPVDFRIRSPLEDDIRLGNAGARAFLRFAPFRLEGVWMPIYLPTELPAVSLPQYVSYGPTAFPTVDLKNGTEGARLHFEIPAVDMSISYVHGFAPLPGLSITQQNGIDQITLTADANNSPSPTMPPSILISRNAYEQQVFGGDFATSLGDFGTLRGEIAYRRPYDGSVPDGHVADPDLQYVLGADHSFGSLSIIVQYMGRYVFDWQKQNGSTFDTSSLPMRQMSDINFVTQTADAILAKDNQILFSQTARVQHLGTVRFEWLGLHETLSISSLCLLNFTSHEWLVTPRIGYKLSDAMMAYLGAQVFHGPTDTLFGIIEAELSSGYAELRYTF
jgi:hypothetical protein